MEPLIVNKYGVVLSGNRRLYVAKKLGWKTIKCNIYTSLTPEIEGAILFALNNTHKNFSDWEQRKPLAKFYETIFIKSYVKKNPQDKGYAEFGKLVGFNYRQARRIIESAKTKKHPWIKKVKAVTKTPGVVDSILDMKEDVRDKIADEAVALIKKDPKVKTTDIRKHIRVLNRGYSIKKNMEITKADFTRLTGKLDKAFDLMIQLPSNIYDKEQSKEVIISLKRFETYLKSVKKHYASL